LSRLFLLFTVVPALELYLLLRLGELFGPLHTLLLIVVTGFVGASLARQQGLSVLRQIAEGLERGVPPGEKLLEGALVLVGGVLLITPGVLTDLTGIVLLFPLTRRLLVPILLRRMALQAQLRGVRVDLGQPGPSAAGPDRTSPHHADPGLREHRPPFDHPIA
jgi:UPF0716 protein FxsA